MTGDAIAFEKVRVLDVAVRVRQRLTPLRAQVSRNVVVRWDDASGGWVDTPRTSGLVSGLTGCSSRDPTAGSDGRTARTRRSIPCSLRVFLHTILVLPGPARSSSSGQVFLCAQAHSMPVRIHRLAESSPRAASRADRGRSG
ncbi:hypothetical protein WME77_40195 [Sorangium sp. So ce764]|uniref:hypothetical protein n=1 Tax=Sorangium sp. So ce764 TaxID=3133320 RepID=UPI003F643C77